MLHKKSVIFRSEFVEIVYLSIRILIGVEQKYRQTSTCSRGFLGIKKELLSVQRQPEKQSEASLCMGSQAVSLNMKNRCLNLRNFNMYLQ